MAKTIIKRGRTSKVVRLFIQDSSKTDGSGLTGLTNATSGLVAYYIREGDASPTAIALSAGTVGTWSSGGFKEISAANMPGSYELGLPDAALSSGETVYIMLRGAPNMVPCPLEEELDGYDPQDATRLGLSALPNVAAGATGGLPTSANNSGQTTAASVAGNVGGNVVGSVASVTAAVTVGTNNDKTGYALTAGEETAIGTAVWAATTRTLTSAAPPTAAQIATAIWQDLTASGDFTTAASIGLLLANLTAGRITNLDHLNTDVSSRATPAQILTTPANLLATDSSGRTTLTPAEHTLVSGTDVPAALTAQGYTTVRAPKLDDLDATVSSRLATSGYTAPPSTAAIIAAFQAQGVTLHPTAGTWDHVMTLMWALVRGKRLNTSPTTQDVYSTDGLQKLLTITYQTGGISLTAAATGSTAVDD